LDYPPRSEAVVSPGSWRATKGVPHPDGSLSSVSVLLVDDDEADTYLIMQVLKAHPRVRTAVARSTPEAALHDLAGGRVSPELILLDIHMPKVDGFAFVRALRELPQARNTPVIFVTTSRRRLDVEHALDTDAFSYLIKPDGVDELRDRLNALIRKCVTPAA
jgi:CheY-like chemotaxis protein